MILTDLDIDCLEEIFEYLKLKDLLNVADSNKRLRHASKFVFARKYGKYDIYENQGILTARVFRRKETLTSVFRRNSRQVNINIPDLKSNLQMLRIFGSLISRIVYNWNNWKCPSHITDYLNDFCSETLSDIEIGRFSNNCLDDFKNPFTMVKTVRIYLCNLVQTNSLVQLFPKMRELIIRDFGHFTFRYNGLIVNHFPYLESIKVDTCPFSFLDNPLYPYNEYIEVFKTFLRLNPQLKHLCMHRVDKASFEVFKFLSESEHSLERLELDINTNTQTYFFNDTNGEKIHLRNLKYLSMNAIYTRGELFRYGIPFLCDQLETFELNFGDPLREWTYEFLQNNSSIRKLKIEFHNCPVDFPRLVQYLPLLEEFSLLSYILSVDRVIYIINLFKFLKYFHFRSIPNFEYKQLEARLNYGWSIRFEPEPEPEPEPAFVDFILERKI